MQMMIGLGSSSLLLLFGSGCLVLVIGALASDFEIAGDRSRALGKAYSKEEKSNILRRYFALEGHGAALNDPLIVDRYDQEIISKMEEVLNDHSGEVDAYKINGRINTMLYDSESKVEDTMRGSFEPSSYYSILRALELILPDSPSDPVYTKAKKELEKFYADEPELAKELLDLFEVNLIAEELHTHEAAKLLRHYYYHWIPLARLAKYIETNAKAKSATAADPTTR